MNCNKDAVTLMHKHLDKDLSNEEQSQLGRHLENCPDCQKHFHELKRTVTLIQSTPKMDAPPGFTQKVMENLPTEKRRFKYVRWFKVHPIFTAAAIFFILMFGGILSSWHQDNKLVVSKQENLEIKGDTVIVPKGITVDGDLVVKNGNLIIEGTVDGNVTLINGKLLTGDTGIAGDGLMASVGEVNGEIKKVDKVFEWVWYSIKGLFKGIFAY